MQRFTSAPKVGRDAVGAWRRRFFRLLSRVNRHRTRNAVRRIERRIRRCAARLDELYGSPHLGNLRDPSAEFAYIVLARKTPERAYQRAFVALKKLGSWELIARQRTSTIAAAIAGCGLEQKKATAIKCGLAITHRKFGRSAFRGAADLDDERLFAFLMALPEVGAKSALCIMLYSFGRPVFPVDAHVGRVIARLGVLRDVLPRLGKVDHKRRQRMLMDAIPTCVTVFT